MSDGSLPQTGDIVADKYRIEEPLGEGGMAIVFAAHHIPLDKPVALKILSPELPRLPVLRERFLTEARAAARVDSAHVARVMDVGTMPNGLPYMVLERLEGCDLGELLQVERQLGMGDAVDYVLQALQGLAQAHTLGVVHRDLKPANLFLAHQSDGSAIIKILDFGIAKLGASDTGESTSRATQQGHTVGTPMYMSPEHVRNETVDHRTDIWAIGVVLYELLTGQTPFEAEGVGETFGAVLTRKPAPARAQRPELPEALDAAIMKCLEQKADDRFQDVGQLARAIGPFGTGSCSFLVESIEQTLRQKLRRQTGKAFLARPITANGMSVTVDALAAHAPTLGDATPPSKPVPVVIEAAPAIVTPLPFPGLRPKYGRWAVIALVVIAAPFAFTALMAGRASSLLPSLPPAALEPVVASAPSPTPTPSANAAASMASAMAAFAPSAEASAMERPAIAPITSAPKSKGSHKPGHATKLRR